jgi:hypothetical protein
VAGLPAALLEPQIEALKLAAPGAETGHRIEQFLSRQQ